MDNMGQYGKFGDFSIKEQQTPPLDLTNIKGREEEIINQYKSVVPLPSELMQSEELMSYCLNTQNIDFINLMWDFHWSEEFVKGKEEKIIELLEENPNFSPPSLLTKKVLMEYCLNTNNIEIISKMWLFIWTDDFIKGREEKIVNIFKKVEYGFPIDLRGSKLLMEYCLHTNNVDFIKDKMWNFFNWTEDFIKEREEQIIKVLQKINEIPLELNKSETMMSYYLNTGNIEYIKQMNLFTWTEDFIKQNLTSIVNLIKNKETSNEILNIINKGTPINSPSLTEVFINAENLEILKQFDKESFTEEVINNNYNKLMELFNNDKNFLLEFIGHKTLINKMVSLKNVTVSVLGFSPEIMENDNILNWYAAMIKIPPHEVKEKLTRLTKKNDKIFEKLPPFLLKFYDENLIEKTLAYSNFNKFLLRASNNNLLINRIFSLLNNDEYDLNYSFVQTLNNLKNYNDLINQVDLNTLDDEKLKNFIFILQRKQNIFNINNINELSNDSMFKKKIEYFSIIDKKIIDNTINITELRSALLEKKYGLSIEMSKFIYNRYCKNIGELKEYIDKGGNDSTKMNKSIYRILLDIASIYKFDTKEKLVYLYKNSEVLETDFYTTLSLESSLRKEYAKMYNNSLYQLNDSHLLNENHQLYKENKMIYDKINESNYNGKKPKFYILDGDFNINIHALSAYHGFDYQKPDNFKEDWERPMTENHGICTSYIGNNQIANARIMHPVYGFSHYEECALLLAGNYDLSSNRANSQFSTSTINEYAFYPPEMMKNLTMHTHNEIVLDRRIIGENNQFKRMPDYVVYFVDDINNLNNFEEKNNLYQETIQASIDLNIPIVIVDRLKYAKSERDKWNKLFEKIKEKPDAESVRNLFYIQLTNRIGCHDFSNGKDIKEYNKYFTDVSVLSNLESIINTVIFNTNINEKEKGIIINAIQSIIETAKKENNKGRAITGSMHNINEKLLNKLETTLEESVKIFIEEENRIISNHK